VPCAEDTSSKLSVVPEGDALHRAALRLQPLVGQRLDVESPNPRAQATQVAPRVDGRVLESVEAVGKNLLLRFEGGLVVRSHLRMTGRWRIEPRGKPRTGLPWLVLRGETLEGVLWNGPVLTLETRNLRRLGQDVLGEEFDAEAAVARLRVAGDAWLGEALQDQRLVAGIGNMWMSEALWSVRTSPWARVREVEDSVLRDAVAAARRLMHEALAGRRQARRVYRHAGRPCSRCGTIIRARGQGDGNRTAYWCPGCQAGGGPPGE
jgi:endonuclease VIII